MSCALAVAPDQRQTSRQRRAKTDIYGAISPFFYATLACDSTDEPNAGTTKPTSAAMTATRTAPSTQLSALFELQPPAPLLYPGVLLAVSPFLTGAPDLPPAAPLLPLSRFSGSGPMTKVNRIQLPRKPRLREKRDPSGGVWGKGIEEPSRLYRIRDSLCEPILPSS